MTAHMRSFRACRGSVGSVWLVKGAPYQDLLGVQYGFGWGSGVSGFRLAGEGGSEDSVLIVFFCRGAEFGVRSEGHPSSKSCLGPQGATSAGVPLVLAPCDAAGDVAKWELQGFSRSELYTRRLS